MKVSREGGEVLLKQESTPSMDLYLDYSSKQNTGLQTDSSYLKEHSSSPDSGSTRRYL